MPATQRLIDDRRGFTLAEMMVSMALTVGLLGAAYSLLTTQVRSYEIQQGSMAARETLRGAATLMTSEIRNASVGRGDLYAIAPQSIALRSLQGAGVICDTLGNRYGVWRASGDFQATANDSTLAFNLTDKIWNSAAVTQVWSSPSAGGIPACNWSGGVPGVVVQLSPGDTTGVRTGSGVRMFRRVQYGIFQQNGQWWLGRAVGAGGGYQLLTGPLESPSDSGLVFHYYDAAGAETTVIGQVVRIELVLRAASTARVSSSTGEAVQRDSLAVAVLMRN